MSKRIGENRKLIWIAIFAVGFLPRLYLCTRFYPYCVYDEGPVLASAAWFAGKDWTGVSSISAYYGWGYYALFFPLLKMTNDFQVIYFWITIINSAVQALYGIIASKCAYTFFSINSGVNLLLIGTISSYMVYVRPVIYNETPLILIVWLLMYFICALIKNENNREKKFKYTVIIGLLICWALTIHTRAVVLFVALFIVEIAYALFLKRSIISVWGIPIIGIVVVAANYVTDYMKNEVWLADVRTSLANSSVSINTENILWTDWTTWKGIFYVIVGQLSTINLCSVGLIALSICIWGIFAFKFLLRKVDWNAVIVRISIVVGTFFTICVFSMILGQSVSWLYAIYPALKSNASGNVEGYKAFSYVRYAYAFAGPIVLLTICLIQKQVLALKKKAFVIIGLSMLVVAKIWAVNILPLLAGNGYALEPYVPFANRKAFEVITDYEYRISLVWTLIFTLAFIFSFLIGKKELYYCMTAGIMIFETIYMGIYNDSVYGQARSEIYKDTYDFFEMISQDYIIPNDIYSYGADYQRLQCYLNAYHILPDADKDELNGELLLYKGNIGSLSIGDADSFIANYVSISDDMYLLFGDDKKLYQLLILDGYEIGQTYLNEVVFVEEN